MTFESFNFASCCSTAALRIFFAAASLTVALRTCEASELNSNSVPVVAVAKSESPPATEPQLDFLRDVVPALTKAGCNAGTCHGSFKGRGGLQLSLLGFNPSIDFDSIVKQGRGRRISITSPEHSLLLRKPTVQIPHGGGQVLKPSDPAYIVLRNWIAQGAIAPPEPFPFVTGIQVSQTDLVMQPGETVTLKVQATWSDGHQGDVTPWALYDAGTAGFATVSKAGEVRAEKSGRLAVAIRYLGQVAVVTVTVPFASQSDLTKFQPRNYIDELVAAEWQKVGLTPAPLCDDTTFIRRVFLDLAGMLPMPAELREWSTSADPEWRSKLVDTLLERPEYVDYWTLQWSDLLRAHRRFLGEKGLGSFQSWMRETIRTNRPVDEWVREMLTARGSLYTNGPVAFYFVDPTPQDLAETTAQVFLGVRLKCARCHHHPFEVWSQEEYYGLAAFFTGVKKKDTREQGLFGGSQSIRVEASQTLPHPYTGVPIGPRMLGHEPLELEADADARPELAAWITDPKNPFFAKNIVNRYWGMLFGRGLVNPIDDLRATNPATYPAVLDALAADFVAHDYDLKYLLRTICNSSVYQLSAELTPTRDEEGIFLTHRVPRRLPAEVMLDAIGKTTGSQEKFVGMPEGTRAIALADPDVKSTFLDIFGRPKRTTTCTCERQNQLDLRQALHLVNNEQLSQKIAASDARVALLLAEKKTDAEICDELYLAALSRLPDDIERAQINAWLVEPASRQETFEDLLWTLINCAEFAFAR